MIRALNVQKKLDLSPLVGHDRLFSKHELKEKISPFFGAPHL
jgi:hypothetical protein